MSLDDIDLGRLDAESDSKLADYFIETGAAGRVLSGKQLVLGRKGTGKTALFVHLKGKLEGVVVDLDLNEYLFSVHRSLRESGVTADSSYTSAWKMVIFASMLGSVSDAMNFGQKSKFRSIMDRLQLDGSRGASAKILGWLRNVKRIELPSAPTVGNLGGIEFQDREASHVGTDFVGAVVELEALAKEVLATTKVTVLIDRIDDVWDGTKESKDFIVGALKAVRSIGLEPHATRSAPVVLFLRTDLWDQVVFNDRNKMSQDIEYLTWEDEDLVRVVERRIESSTEGRVSSWTDVFFDGEMRQRASSRTYMVKRTMGRPRDIVAYSTFALEAARQSGSSRLRV